MKSLSCVPLFATPWTVAYQAPPSMGFSRQQYWSGLPFPSPGDLPNPGIEPRSPAFQADALTSEPPGKPILGYSWLINSVILVSGVQQSDSFILLHVSFLFNGEGNGTPLQYSCLENPWMKEPGRLQSMGSRRVRRN